MQVQVSNFFPLERYYEAADKVLQSFEKAYSEQRLDDAYVLGKRYARYSLESLPQHDYFRSSKYAVKRRDNDQHVQRVLQKLEQVALWMDAEEAQREKLRLERRRRLEQERVRQQEAIEKARYQELEQRIAMQQKKSSRSVSESSVKESALSKLQMLGSSSPQLGGSSLKPQRLSSGVSEMNIGNGDKSSLNGESGHDRPSSQHTTGGRRSRWQQNERSDSSQLSDTSLPPPLPPPIPPPIPPPSYDQIVSKDHLRPPQKHTVAAPAGGAVVRSKSDLISLPSDDLSEVLPPPPPYCEYQSVFVDLPFVCLPCPNSFIPFSFL
jgi:hypothetical protein